MSIAMIWKKKLIVTYQSEEGDKKQIQIARYKLFGYQDVAEKVSNICTRLNNS